MAVVTRGRVIRQVDAETATRLAGAATDVTDVGGPHVDAEGTARRGRVVPRALVDAHAEAERIVARAHEDAQRIVLGARVASEEAIRAAAEEARAAAVAQLAAQFLVLRAREEKRAEADLTRTTELAVVLAERLVRGAIELDPVHVVTMAKGALAEVRGARRAVVEMHPLDAEAVRGHLVGVGLDVELREAPELSRGDLRLHTDLGTLDARLTVQLERLAAALADALRG